MEQQIMGLAARNRVRMLWLFSCTAGRSEKGDFVVLTEALQADISTTMQYAHHVDRVRSNAEARVSSFLDGD